MIDRTNLKPFTMENAQLLMNARNFAGRPGKYTPQGVREFVLRLPPDLADQLAEDGWNVTYLKPREEGDLPEPILRVSVNYNYWQPPEIYKVVGRSKTLLNEDNVSVLDTAEISNVDLRVRPRFWGDENKGGIKAYLEKMYVTVVEDDLDAKYNFDDAEVPFN